MLHQIGRLVKHTGIYGAAEALGRALRILLVPLYTRAMSEGEMGLMALAFTFTAFAQVFCSLGMRAAVLRFFADEEAHEERVRMVSTTFAALLVVSGVSMLVLWAFSKPLAEALLDCEYGALIWMIGGILLFDTLSLVGLVVLRAQERSTTYAVVSLTKFGLILGLNLLLILGFRRRLWGVFESNLIVSGLIFAITFPYVLPYLRPYLSRAWLRRLLAFGLPYIPAVAAVMVIDLSDRYLLKFFLGNEAVGLYQVAYTFGMMPLLLVRAFALAWPPFFLSVAKGPDAERICARVLTYYLLVSGLIFLGAHLFARDLLQILTPENYATAADVMPLVTLSYIIYGVYINLIVGVYLKKKTGYLPFITGAGAIVNVALNFLLIPRFGMIGAAWATVAAYGTMATGLYWVSRGLYPVKYEWGRIAKIVVVSGLFAALRPLIVSDNFALRSGLLLAYLPLLLLLQFFPTGELREVRDAYLRFTRRDAGTRRRGDAETR